jgi:Yip1 domain
MDVIDQEVTVQEFTDKEVLTKIWITPYPVFKFIRERGYEKNLWPILILIGVANVLDQDNFLSINGEFWNLGMLIFKVVASIIISFVSMYVYAGLISWTGGWIGGQPQTWNIYKVISYASIPTICTIAIWVLRQLITGSITLEEIENSEHDLSVMMFLSYALLLVDFVLSIWALVLMVTGVSEAQKFGAGKAFLNLLLPLLIFGVPIWLVMLSLI